jgi:xylulokinase
MDQTAALVGAAAIREGVVIETTGSALVVCQAGGVFPAGRQLSLPVHYHAIADMYFLLSMCSAGGLSLKWLRDTFFKTEAAEAAAEGKDVYTVMTDRAGTIPPGSEGLLFYPFMSGPGTLAVDPELRGIMFGLQLHHEKGHFVRSIMEAIAFVIRESLEQMAELGFQYREIRSLGGGAKSMRWTKIKAAVLGRPVTVMKCPETAALGTAALQAAALGVYPDIRSAAEAMSSIYDTIEPEPALLTAYEEVYHRYRSIEKNYFAAGATEKQ